MLSNILKQYYGVEVEENLKISKYDACRNKNDIYILIPTGKMVEEELSELEEISTHLVKHGDRSVSEFMKTKEGSALLKLESNSYCILVNRNIKRVKWERQGRKLAKFHHRGRLISFQVNKINRIGQWKQFWEQRLNQMEKVWNDKLFQHPENEFERMFLESFPYYMGLTENAIQYLVDTEMDDNPAKIDYGTVCHMKFTKKTWGDQYYVKNPFTWVFDHCSRDIAEWTRERYFYNSETYQPELIEFLKDYQTVLPLSSFSWRLLYSRLLFPLHFYNCIEGYYISNSEQQQNMMQDQLNKYLKKSGDYERFLRDFYQIGEAPIKKSKIPVVSWLLKTK